jgi:hypothetical protein
MNDIKLRNAHKNFSNSKFRFRLLRQKASGKKLAATLKIHDIIMVKQFKV